MSPAPGGPFPEPEPLARVWGGRVGPLQGGRLLVAGPRREQTDQSLPCKSLNYHAAGRVSDPARVTVCARARSCVCACAEGS